jgi:23S rRNA (cytidine1920-2'-O)/16S rRNA (cytidine1409-2'-O)-methyltransferase
MAKPPKKLRLDVALVERDLAESRARAKAIIMAGLVFKGTQRLNKASVMVAAEDEITVKGRDHRWVSRGGVKLAHGLSHFKINPTGAVCVDVGASTGGFTDVLLANGAAKVFAVDVGHGQLDWKLRNDPRVVVLERTNARHLTTELIPDSIDVIVCDASFIGLRTVLPAAMALAKSATFLVALIKPQFEVGKGQVGKGGVVRDPDQHRQVCDEIREWVSGLTDWQVIGIEPSPIKGPEGNVEFLIAAEKVALQGSSG